MKGIRFEPKLKVVSSELWHTKSLEYLINIITVNKQWRWDSYLAPIVSSTISATDSVWAASQESSSTSSVGCGMPPEKSASLEVSICSKKEHRFSEVVPWWFRKFRTLGWIVLDYWLRTNWSPRKRRSSQPNRGRCSNWRFAGLSFGSQSGPQKRSFWRDDPGLNRSCWKADDEVPKYECPWAAKRNDR